MLCLIDNQFFEAEPVPSPVGDYQIRFNAESNTIEAYIGSRRIFWGVKYYSYSKIAEIDPNSGKINVKGVGLARFRAVFGDSHLDLEQNFV